MAESSSGGNTMETSSTKETSISDQTVATPSSSLAAGDKPSSSNEKNQSNGSASDNIKEEAPFLFSCLLCGFKCDRLSTLYTHTQTPPHTVYVCPPRFTNPKIRVAEWLTNTPKEGDLPEKIFRSLMTGMSFATYEEIEAHVQSTPNQHVVGGKNRKQGGVDLQEDLVYDCGHSDLSEFLEKNGSISLPHLSSADSIAGRVFMLSSRVVYEGAEIVEKSVENSEGEGEGEGEGRGLSLQERVAKRIKTYHPDCDTEALFASSTTTSASSPAPAKVGEQGQLQLHTCNLCRIHCYTKVNFDQHMKGKKHLAALQKSKERQDRQHNPRTDHRRDHSSPSSSRYQGRGDGGVNPIALPSRVRDSRGSGIVRDSHDSRRDYPSRDRDRGYGRDRDRSRDRDRGRRRSPSPHHPYPPPSHPPPSSSHPHYSYPPPAYSYPPSYPSSHSVYPPNPNPHHAPSPSASYPPSYDPPSTPSYPPSYPPPHSTYPPSNAPPPNPHHAPPPSVSYPPSYDPPSAYPPSYPSNPYPSYDPNQPVVYPDPHHQTSSPDRSYADPQHRRQYSAPWPGH